PDPPSNLMSGQQATVPDVSGQSEDQVIALLEGLGFTAQKGKDKASGVTKGLAVGTSPGAGSRVSQGAVVTYYLSNGTLTQTMPDVIGMSQSNAASAVAGQTSGAISYTYVMTADPLQYCKVSASSPAPGAKMSATQAVTLTVYSDTDGTETPPGLCAP